MLRAEGRLRAGVELKPAEADRLEAFKRGLREQGAVIHYDGDTEQGFFRVPAREGIDTDLIRVPPQKTTRAKAADDYEPKKPNNSGGT
ncbi:hypothetical protein [Kineococcus esterisolvens]|uniref:hypothetical protein n=1 Tax=unclassified Kineococcus TaxID=2621656 RepID=UPI003D7C854C